MTLHWLGMWLRHPHWLAWVTDSVQQGAKQMLSKVDDCVICGEQGLIKRRPWWGVRQKDVETFILFLWLTSPTQQPQTVQNTHVYQHLEKTATVQSARAFKNIPHLEIVHLEYQSSVTISHDSEPPCTIPELWNWSSYTEFRDICNHPCSPGKQKVSVSMLSTLDTLCCAFFLV